MNEIAAQLPADTAAAPGRSYALPIGAWLKPYRVEVALIGVAALASAALMLWLAHSALLAAAFCGGALILGALVILIHRLYPPRAGNAVIQDWGMLREAAAQKDSAIAITDRSGRLVCANDTYATWFEAYVAPAKLGLDSTTTEAFNQAGRAAWRDGNGNADVRDAAGRHLSIETLRVGRNEDHLLWRFTRQDGSDVAQDVALLLTSKAGVLAGMAGIMLVLVDADGRIKACNPAFAQRATGELNAALGGSEFVAALASDTSGMIRFKREAAGLALRLVQVSLSTEGEDGGDSLILLLDQDGGGMPLAGAGGNLQNLLEKLPLGLALTDRDCRFIFLNSAFRRAAGVPKGTTPIYPGDLVIREDKAAVADTVRRFANGTGQSGDLAVRLNTRPEEPVALSLAGAKGLGEAAVLLSLKDNSEEARLKREIAQATKMQAVGQLAGGVAHDFNNVLTAIIGTCDLMLLRHTPGDSDYGDIHQIKLNSNRAANLTRQLLAFSRQQTLRPQILQLPDVISEVSNLLQRVMGETVRLDIEHGRDLGAIRADPGQLEQVIVNLSVNARDAMPRGGTVKLRTFAFPASEVRKLGNEIMPITDYTGFSLADKGTGIAPEIMGKIFEPFFTTKGVNKGTGLGLSTVYGIVKQSGGFIFAASEIGRGTIFTVYLPVHKIDTAVPAPASVRRERTAELWGTGKVLLVEDEDMVRAVAERALTRQGYTVLTAANGEEGIAVLNANTDIVLLISDVVMPVMDGPTMVRHARERLPNLPVLFMSGYAEEQLRKSIDLENVAFVPKPFSVQQLAEAARGALGQAEQV